jgi:RimJ/RimL family protein N-acetyltransferase
MWPFFDLRVRTPRLELRLGTDADLLALAELAAAGIHDPDFMPFGFPWSDLPPDERGRSVLQFNWRQRAGLTPDDWSLDFVTVVDGKVVGTQGITARQFAILKVVHTGSWLGRAHQGTGIGKEMRAAVLHFAFAGLGAARAESGAWEDNHPSLGVSRALGYTEDGDEILPRRGIASRQIRLKLGRTDWETNRRDDIVIEGLEPCLPLLGGPDPDPSAER